MSAIVAAAGVATWQAIEATRQRDEANRLRERGLSRQLAAQSASLLVRNPVLALQLAAEADAVAATAEGRSALLGAITALPVSRLHQHASAWRALAVSRQDQVVLSDLLGGVYRTGVEAAALHTVVPPPGGLALFTAVDAIAFADDGARWAHAGSSGEITVRSGADVRKVESGDKVGEMNPSLRVLGLAFDPSGRLLATASTSGAILVHDLAGGTRRAIGGAAVDLAALAFSRDGRWVVAGGDQGFLKAFPVDARASAPAFAGRARGTVDAVAFDAAGRRLFTASRAGRIEVFDTATGKSTTARDVLEHGALERWRCRPRGVSSSPGMPPAWWCSGIASPTTASGLRRCSFATPPRCAGSPSPPTAGASCRRVPTAGSS